MHFLNKLVKGRKKKQVWQCFQCKLKVEAFEIQSTVCFQDLMKMLLVCLFSAKKPKSYLTPVYNGVLFFI